MESRKNANKCKVHHKLLKNHDWTRETRFDSAFGTQNELEIIERLVLTSSLGANYPGVANHYAKRFVKSELIPSSPKQASSRKFCELALKILVLLECYVIACSVKVFPETSARKWPIPGIKWRIDSLSDLTITRSFPLEWISQQYTFTRCLRNIRHFLLYIPTSTGLRTI